MGGCEVQEGVCKKSKIPMYDQLVLSLCIIIGSLTDLLELALIPSSPSVSISNVLVISS